MLRWAVAIAIAVCVVVPMVAAGKLQGDVAQTLRQRIVEEVAIPSEQLCGVCHGLVKFLIESFNVQKDKAARSTRSTAKREAEAAITSSAAVHEFLDGVLFEFPRRFRYVESESGLRENAKADASIADEDSANTDDALMALVNVIRQDTDAVTALLTLRQAHHEEPSSSTATAQALLCFRGVPMCDKEFYATTRDEWDLQALYLRVEDEVAKYHPDTQIPPEWRSNVPKNRRDSLGDDDGAGAGWAWVDLDELPKADLFHHSHVGDPMEEGKPPIEDDEAAPLGRL